ncbi:ABC transporter substrate-binding protein [Clostridium sp.]|uniref:ABC transporter substrate-binding protein n=1 Tax=Clostridium sp. TaxID=1506 RepID=UPI002FC7C1F6
MIFRKKMINKEKDYEVNNNFLKEKEIDNFALLNKDIKKLEIIELLQNQKYQNIMSQKIITQVEESLQVTEMLLTSVNQVNIEIGKQDNHITKTVDTSNTVAAFSQEINAGVVETLRVIDDTLQHAEKGQQSLKNVEVSMDNIKNIVETMELTMKDLVNKSNKIKGIVDTIKGIAKTTHLLSLNANIEAARAGDSGRGFSVVAGEVKKLAENSSKSADEIDKIIVEISNVTEATSNIIQQSVEKVMEGSSVTQEAGKVIDDMMVQIQTTRETSNKIGEAVVEQANKNQNMLLVIEDMVKAIDSVKALNENISVDTYRQKVSLNMLQQTITNLNTIASKGINDTELDERFLYMDTQEPTTFDPTSIIEAQFSRIIQPLNLGLVQVGPSVEPIGAIAQTWHLEEDNITWNFTLRKDMRFHNGRKITAKDIKYSYERLLSSTLNSPNRWFLSMIKGADEFYNGRSKEVSGIMVNGDFNMKIVLQYPYTSFINNLTHISCSILPKEEEGKIKNTPIGAGPYRFISFDKEQGKIIYSRFDQYNLGQALIDNIILNTDNQNTVERFINNEADFVEVNGINKSKIVNAGYNIHVTECIGSRFLLFNFFRNNPLIHSKDVRQAINYVVDKQKIENEVFSGMEPIAKSVFPTIILKNPSTKVYNRDVRKAQDLMKKSGIKQGTIKFGVSKNEEKNTTHYMLSNILRDNLREINISLEIVEIDPKNYYNFDAIQDVDMMLYGWLGDSGTADNFIEPLIDINNTSNLSKYSNPELMELLNTAKATKNPYTYNEILYSLDSKIYEDAAYVFLSHISLAYATSKDIKGFKVHPLNLIKLEDVWR